MTGTGKPYCHGVLDGMTLKQRIAGQPLEMEKVLSLSIEITDAVEMPRTTEESFTATSRRRTFS